MICILGQPIRVINETHPDVLIIIKSGTKEYIGYYDK